MLAAVSEAFLSGFLGFRFYLFVNGLRAVAHLLDGVSWPSCLVWGCRGKCLCCGEKEAG